MDLSKATPQQIFEYKRDWKSKASIVKIHSDLDVAGKDWCRTWLNRWQWSFEKFTDVYEHTFLFEYEYDAKEFKEKFGKYTK